MDSLEEVGLGGWTRGEYEQDKCMYKKFSV